MLFGLKMLLCYTAGIWGLFNMIYLVADWSKQTLTEDEEEKDVVRQYFAFLNDGRE